MAVKANRLTNANVYVNGNSLLGQVEEIDVPALKAKMVEHKALGMIGTIELPSGFEKLEGKMKWNAFYPDAMGKIADVYATQKLQVRGNLESYDSTGRFKQQSVVAYLTVNFKSFPGMAFKQNDNVEMESEYSCTYMRIESGGLPVLEIDLLAQIYSVGGVDKVATYRNSLGI